MSVEKFSPPADLVHAGRRSHLGAATQHDRDLLAIYNWTPHTGGRNNGVYNAHIDALQLCFKFYKNDGRLRAQREWASLHFLREHGITRAPEPLYCEEGSGAALVVMEHIPGQHLGKSDLTQTQVTALTQAIKALQQLPFKREIPWLGQLTAEQRHASIAKFMRETSALHKDQKRCLALWAHWLKNADSQSLHDARDMVFSRWDTNLSNMLWDGDILRFVDWEYGGWMEWAFDLAEQIEHIQSRSTADAQWAYFIELFELDRRQLNTLRTARQVVAFEWAKRFWPMAGTESAATFTQQLARLEELCTAF